MKMDGCDEASGRAAGMEKSLSGVGRAGGWSVRPVRMEEGNR